MSEAKLGVFESWSQSPFRLGGFKSLERLWMGGTESCRNSTINTPSFPFGNQCLFCAFGAYPILWISHLAFFKSHLPVKKFFKKGKQGHRFSGFVHHSKHQTPDSKHVLNDTWISSSEKLCRNSIWKILIYASSPLCWSHPSQLSHSSKNTGSLPVEDPCSVWFSFSFAPMATAERVEGSCRNQIHGIVEFWIDWDWERP